MTGLSRTVWMVFLRLLAIAHVAGAAVLWFYLLGGVVPEVTPAPFLSLPLTTQTMLAVLAVLYPLVAIGLWTLNAGGQVLWAGAAALQLVGLAAGAFDAFTVWPVAVAVSTATLIYAGFALAFASRRVTTA